MVSEVAPGDDFNAVAGGIGNFAVGAPADVALKRDCVAIKNHRHGYRATPVVPPNSRKGSVKVDAECAEEVSRLGTAFPVQTESGQGSGLISSQNVGLVHRGVCLTLALHGLLHHRFGATAEVVLVPAAEVPATWALTSRWKLRSPSPEIE